MGGVTICRNTDLGLTYTFTDGAMENQDWQGVLVRAAEAERASRVKRLNARATTIGSPGDAMIEQELHRHRQEHTSGLEVYNKAFLKGLIKYLVFALSKANGNNHPTGAIIQVDWDDVTEFGQEYDSSVITTHNSAQIAVQRRRSSDEYPPEAYVKTNDEPEKPVRKVRRDTTKAKQRRQRGRSES